MMTFADRFAEQGLTTVHAHLPTHQQQPASRVHSMPTRSPAIPLARTHSHAHCVLAEQSEDWRSEPLLYTTAHAPPILDHTTTHTCARTQRSLTTASPNMWPSSTFGRSIHSLRLTWCKRFCGMGVNRHPLDFHSSRPRPGALSIPSPHAHSPSHGAVLTHAQP
jgi:hypothetical protein